MDWNADMSAAPRNGTPIKAFNGMVGEWDTSYVDGKWPMTEWQGQTGTWYPEPICWRPQPPEGE